MEEKKQETAEKPVHMPLQELIQRVQAGIYVKTQNSDELIEAQSGHAYHYDRQKEELVLLPGSAFATGAEIAARGKPKVPFVINDDALVEFAERLGMDKALARMHFMVISGTLYVKISGLLALAVMKRPVQAIAFVSEDMTQKDGTHYAHAVIWPRIDYKTLQVISNLALTQPAMAQEMWGYVTKPTEGFGRAAADNVSMTQIHKFLPEMAQTRAVARALRLYTGFGFTAAEETQEGEPNADIAQYKYVPKDAMAPPDGPAMTGKTAEKHEQRKRKEPAKEQVRLDTVKFPLKS